MPWSEGVIEQFEIVDLYTTEESDFYGPFNSLLVELFPSSEHYQVSPQFKRIDGSLDFTIQFIVHRRRIPVFFLEVKTFRSLTLLSARDSADDQMRQRFREFASGTIPTATLYGISAFGPQFCVYAFESATRSIDPPAVARDLVVVNDIAPEARWAYNLLEPGGEAKFREVVNAVKGMTAGL
ncbi:hypothetical protein PILCRDRAFT_824776 [Piloderma croceum F 1598]|jgi:hypothetical protein|uniref:Fungal-type protein kinase domain-containing protein n=1 Tax=Piloderma croceum (strain F 1598) TaxID=765440 RepID=A0A0C3FDV8_PILCF|nr:hypothetical protein PILCRDRAFT_824776 [Piloderma croceum F 1598]